MIRIRSGRLYFQRAGVAVRTGRRGLNTITFKLTSERLKKTSRRVRVSPVTGKAFSIFLFDDAAKRSVFQAIKVVPRNVRLSSLSEGERLFCADCTEYCYDSLRCRAYNFLQEMFFQC